MALMAIGANAQEEKYAVETGFLPDNAGQTLEAGSRKNATSVAITYGADGKWSSFKGDDGAEGSGAKTDATLPEFTAFISGGNNPKDGELNGTSSAGGGYSITGKNLPKSGTYYAFKPTKNGSLKVGIQLNGDKSFFVVKEDGTAMSDYDLKDVEGTTIAVRQAVTDGAPFCSIETKLYGYVTFNVEKDKTYYVFCTGSKLGFYGFIFNEAAATIDPATTAAVKADIDAAAGGGEQGGGEQGGGEQGGGETTPTGTVIFSWTPEATTGGTVVASDGQSVGYDNPVGEVTYKTIRVNGKKADMNTNYIEITLEQALQAGDIISITAYRNKDTDAQSSLYFLFENGTIVDDEFIFDNVALGKTPNTHNWTVAEAAGSKSFKLSRGIASTNVFITAMSIVRDAATAIETVKAADAENAVIYNLAGQKVDNSFKGVVIKNGKKMIQK